ncbi:hypothetical protein [Archangium sp.]|uniref:hypothetical protein n=1 Tax=Archangium sp. TaxID=1872627 RepID=UPI002EDAC9B7
MLAEQVAMLNPVPDQVAQNTGLDEFGKKATGLFETAIAEMATRPPTTATAPRSWT